MFKKIIKINKDQCNGRYLSFFNEKIDLYFYNEWKQLKGDWNWITFNFIQLEIEKDNHCGNGHIDCMLLGLGFGVRFMYGKMDKELEKRLNETVKDMKVIGYEMKEIKEIFDLPKDIKNEDVIKYLKKYKKIIKKIC